MSDFKPKTAVASTLPEVENGSLIATRDTGDLYVDISGSRIKLSDVITGTYSGIMSLNAPLSGKIYFATDTHQLLQAVYSGGSFTWKLLIFSESEIIHNSDSNVNITLLDNKIYYLNNANISTITLIASNTLNYCTVCFTAGNSTTFSPPNGGRCIGFDCSGGVFFPVSGKEYQIAIDKLNNVLTLYILRVNLD